MIKKLLISFIVIIALVSITYANNKKEAKVPTIKNDNNSALAIMVEQNNGTYQAANSIPEFYALNTELSGCENGGTVSYDGTNIVMKANSTEKCYLYFDIAYAPHKYWTYHESTSGGYLNNQYLSPHPSNAQANFASLNLTEPTSVARVNFNTTTGSATSFSFCLYYNNKLLCIDTDYWVSGDSNGSQTLAKLQADIAEYLETDLIYCENYSSNVSCYFGAKDYTAITMNIAYISISQNDFFVRAGSSAEGHACSGTATNISCT